MSDSHASSHDAAHANAEPDQGDLWGMMGLFETPADLYHACEGLRDAGYKAIDAMTPFPVHGLEKALAIKPTPLPWFSITGGFCGLSSAIALTYYVAIDYPINISGKPAFSWHIYIPVYFELTILLTALFTFVAIWGLSRLPTFFHASMRHKSFPRSSDDGFFITVEASDPKYHAEKTKKLLEKLGAKEIQEVHS